MLDRLSPTRRAALKTLGLLTTAALVPQLPTARGENAESRTQLGLVIYDCGIRRRWLQQTDPSVDLFEPLAFLRHCHALGAGGMQAALGTLSADRIRELRDFAGQHNLYIEAIVRPPREESDVDRFAAEIRTAAEVGALAARTVVMPGRRYEQFDSMAAYRAAEVEAERMLRLAAPVVERHRLPLAVENHKDQRIEDRVALLRRLGCEYIGACVDTGNSFALLDDPYDAVEQLAPFAFSVHLKDQAVREYDGGFLLGDIPLGQGCFDLPRMMAALRKAKPTIRFSLELITRDPLKVTCLTEKYWTTMQGVSGADLARTLRIVRSHAADNLQQVSSLSLDQQVALEEANITASLRYARQHLAL
ncbi:MAG: sugar phosphate isomerase/epimerase [Planctomycetales bacterium]|nr:sugar phosphate isomerase/epimerase [Planctomycetales bacterium]